MNKIKINSRLSVAVLLLLLALSPTVLAQHIRGAVEGTVTDPNGAVISGAKVMIKNEATNAEITATTNERGYFNFQNLEAGTYNVTVEQKGFRRYVAKDVSVKVVL